MKARKITVAIIIATVLICQVFAQGFGQNKMQNNRKQNTQFAKGPQNQNNAINALNLTDEEIEKAKEIVSAMQKICKEAQTYIAENRAKIDRLLLASKPDTKAIETIEKSTLDYELKIRMARINAEIALKSLLGDERWAMVSFDRNRTGLSRGRNTKMNNNFCFNLFSQAQPQKN